MFFSFLGIFKVCCLSLNLLSLEKTVHGQSQTWPVFVLQGLIIWHLSISKSHSSQFISKNILDFFQILPMSHQVLPLCHLFEGLFYKMCPLIQLILQILYLCLKYHLLWLWPLFFYFLFLYLHGIAHCQFFLHKFQTSS